MPGRVLHVDTPAAGLAIGLIAGLQSRRYFWPRSLRQRKDRTSGVQCRRLDVVVGSGWTSATSVSTSLVASVKDAVKDDAPAGIVTVFSVVVDAECCRLSVIFR